MHPRRWLLLVLLIFFLAACSHGESGSPIPITGDSATATLVQGNETPAFNSNSPNPGDDALTRADVHIQSLTILTKEGFPPAYLLKIIGSLPTPCHQLRTDVGLPTLDNRIHVQVYSVVDLKRVCPQVVQPYQTTVSLGSYVRGTYIVLVNDQIVGQITP